MSTMLNFKHGLYAKLPQAISNGTIYVTTDEKAMYVDLNDQRIRLSQIITLDTFAWQNLTPPYSTEAFYYVSDANALLKYTGTQWVQLNSTADIDNVLSALGFLGLVDALPATGVKGQICTFNGQNYVYNPDAASDSKWVALSNVGGKFLDLEAAIDALDGRLDAAETKLATLEPAMETAQADIDVLELVVGYKGKLDAVPSEAGVVGDVYLIGDKFYTYVPEINGAAAHWAEVGNESARIENLKKRIEEVALAAGDKTAVEQLANDLSDLAAAVNHAETGLAATKAIADEAKAKADTAVQSADFNVFKEANDKAIADAKAAGTTAQSDLAAYVASNNSAVSGIDTRLGVVESNYLKKDGSVAMEGALDLNGHKILNVVAPENNLDAANKAYVDAQVKIAKDAADAAQGTANGAATAAGEAMVAAQNAQKTADEAKQIAEAAVTDGELADAIKDFATKSEAQAMADAKDEAIAAAKKAGDDAGIKAGENEAAIKAIVNDADLKSFADVKTAIGNINTNLGNNYATKSELNDAKTAILGADAVEGQTVAGAYVAAGDAAAAAGAAQSAIDAMKLGANSQTLKEIEDKIAALKVDDIAGMDAYATDNELANAVAAARGETSETVASVDVKAEANAAAIEALDKEIDALAANVDKKIQAADAMTYEGTVEKADDLAAKTNVNKGDTYKAIKDFILGDKMVYIGDLLIATGTENEETGVLDTVVWDHVPSGYRADYVPALAIDNGVADDNIVVVNLTSAHAAAGEAGDLGNITISAAANSAVTISAINTADKAGSIAIGMAWGSF